MIYDCILGTIGRTPVVHLQRLAPPHVTVYAKVESFNPGGSVKDRLALAIILDADARGELKPGDTAGTTATAALEVARTAADGAVILAMLPDTGERYLGTFLFEGVNEGSDDDWLDWL